MNANMSDSCRESGRSGEKEGREEIERDDLASGREAENEVEAAWRKRSWVNVYHDLVVVELRILFVKKWKWKKKKKEDCQGRGLKMKRGRCWGELGVVVVP